MLIDLYQIASRYITYIDVALSSIKLSHTYKIKKTHKTHTIKKRSTLSKSSKLHKYILNKRIKKRIIL